jgi:cell division protein FtsA
MSQNRKKGKIVACLDMGSSKLVCIIASISQDEIEILGHAYKESKGISSSAISDMRLAQKSITSVVSEAERMAGFNIDRLLVGISGSQVDSVRKEVTIKIASDIVKSSDIANLAAKIRNEFRKNHREVIHLIPLQYHIDDSAPITNPRYMSGEKLHARFHIVSTSQTTIKNIENCFKRCQLSVSSYVVEPYASALSSLTENEMNLGVMIIDVGGSSTSFSIILEGKVVYVGSSPIGGIHITKDISTILGINFDMAEKIKSLNSSLLISPIEEKETIKFKVTDSTAEDGMVRVTRQEMCEIIRLRLEELFESVKSNLEQRGLPIHMLNSIVLTGGVTVTVGIDKLASEIFDKNVRIGYPSKFDLAPSEMLNQNHSCSLGMLVFLQNLYLKEKIKNGFETKDSWFRRFVEKLSAI